MVAPRRTAVAAGAVGSLRHERRPDLPRRAKILLVFLPGRGTTGQDFDRQGFLAALPPDAPVDSITVDLTYPYYERRIMVERLHQDVIAPALASGYRRIWLVGCSMGGLGAIAYDSRASRRAQRHRGARPIFGRKRTL